MDPITTLHLVQQRQRALRAEAARDRLSRSLGQRRDAERRSATTRPTRPPGNDGHERGHAR